jgi:hypothetical protein
MEPLGEKRERYFSFPSRRADGGGGGTEAVRLKR